MDAWVGYIMYSSLLPFYKFALVVLYCIVSIHLYSASCSAHQSEVLPVRDTPREESSLERMKRGTMAHQLKMGKKDCEGPCLSHRSPRSRDKEIMMIM